MSHRKSTGPRQPGLKSAPMLVMRGLVNDRQEIRERMAVQSFSAVLALRAARVEHADTDLE